MKVNEKEYLGDGVYAQFDGYQIVLTTENGVSVTNAICLDRSVFYSLVKFEQKLHVKTQD
jgi:hypothetical protein